MEKFHCNFRKGICFVFKSQDQADLFVCRGNAGITGRRFFCIEPDVQRRFYTCAFACFSETQELLRRQTCLRSMLRSKGYCGKDGERYGRVGKGARSGRKDKEERGASEW